MELKIKKVSERIGRDIPAPSYASAGSAGMDLRACLDAPAEIGPGASVLVPTGVAVSIPAGFAGMVYARSGLAVKSGIALSNGVGVVDSDYRGEIKVGLINLSSRPFLVQPGDRIAQLVITPVCMAGLRFVNDLDETERGESGFGSTGLK